MQCYLEEFWSLFKKLFNYKLSCWKFKKEVAKKEKKGEIKKWNNRVEINRIEGNWSTKKEREIKLRLEKERHPNRKGKQKFK